MEPLPEFEGRVLGAFGSGLGEGLGALGLVWGGFVVEPAAFL
jgi:hypothetical protein